MMPAWHRDAEGLVFYRCGFSSSFFFRRLISEVTERISIKLGHIFTYDWKIEKNLKSLIRTFLGHLPPRAGAKKTFWGPTLKFERTYLCIGTSYQQLERNLSIYSNSRTCFPKLMNFDPETAENGWRVLAHLLNFLIGKHCQPYRMDVI